MPTPISIIGEYIRRCAVRDLQEELDELENSESSCQKPCHPETGCPECAGYWQKMIMEGYWSDHGKRWTDRGWKEIIKS